MNTVEELIEDLKQNKMIILLDDEDRENEGDLVCPAATVTSEMINFMAQEARGLICLSLPDEQIEQLKLPFMVPPTENKTSNKTAFTISVEAAQGVSTGISAADRAHTIRVTANPKAKPEDIICPGHVFPIRARKGGVLKRAGHTEGSVDLMKWSGLEPGAVICEIMNPDGTMARLPELKAFAQKFDLKIGTIVDLIEYALKNDFFLEEVYKEQLEWRGKKPLFHKVFLNNIDGNLHHVYQVGEKLETPLVRVHRSKGPLNFVDHGPRNVAPFLRSFDESKEDGIFVLLNPFILHAEGEANRLEKTSTDHRTYGVGAQILKSLGVDKIKLISGSEKGVAGLGAFGVKVLKQIEPENYFKGEFDAN